VAELLALEVVWAARVGVFVDLGSNGKMLFLLFQGGTPCI
jgi:hypothetical protein